ncbi:MAG: TAXI family TRAP transporter solute-binding subunit [Lachnospiraceae bacterium]|nr:TAXI family TRAP transporter solute-binding subunit [Lachnospiraceae bacterium]
MRKLLSLALATALTVSALAGCGGSSSGTSTQAGGSGSQKDTQAAAESGDPVFWTVAAPPASSALYPYWVSLGEAISSVYPQYKITVSESQGAVAITKSVRNGDADFGNSVSATDYESYHGVGTFDGQPSQDSRMLFYYEVTAEMFCVTKESGIETLADLDGKKFNPGGTGTSAEDICKKIMNLLGYEPDYFTASQADASDAYSNREIVGTIKLGPVVDSYVMQLDAAVPVNLISMSDEEIARIREEFPYLIEVTVPGGTYDGVEEDVKTVGTPQGCQTTTALSQEDGYHICKAVFEDGKEVWQAAYPTGAENDYVALTLASTVPLHAGTVQYLTEAGVEVPEELIPEEYVPVQ